MGVGENAGQGCEIVDCGVDWFFLGLAGVVLIVVFVLLALLIWGWGVGSGVGTVGFLVSAHDLVEFGHSYCLY